MKELVQRGFMLIFAWKWLEFNGHFVIHYVGKELVQESGPPRVQEKD